MFVATVIPIRIDVARHQRMIDAGKAMMYRIVRVKLTRRNTFPAIPHASDVALRAMHLVGLTLFAEISAICAHHRGSPMSSCAGAPDDAVCPSSLLFHGITRATIDMRFARGAVVAATSGIAVDAIHQSCGPSSSAGLGLN